MDCRPGCGACCIAPSISQPYHGMPEGKPAGVRCVHLDDQLRCGLFGDPRRPAACSAFVAEESFCGENREQALAILAELEILSLPD
ncbi:YkgJ family cysteine cluster protein [Parahaliea maris]|uniref:YkgJ family cysteine cluster protein n=1 Tax=Parahaliea maris TaxID=2716870 RepID=A0A5C9AAT9_9GAMM|nr:YkgJ family cysteine cluster protein [Parahaliea maris]TXS96431.1 YkgJ family cysteine cluster protein [Parahaliea maris]